jgi:dethiobiotin synthetase
MWRMTATFFITGTDTGVGKTVFTALLARFLGAQQLRVAALKPLCSGGRGDARELHRAGQGRLRLDDVNPWHFRAAIAPALAARREKRRVKLASVLAHIRTTRQSFDATLVEGAGGLLSPLGENFDSRDVIIALRATPVIVAPNRLGTVNHLLLTLAALPRSLRARASLVLMAPAKADSATGSNAALLGEFFPAERIFTLPWLGGPPDYARALRNPRVRQTLGRMLNAQPKSGRRNQGA